MSEDERSDDYDETCGGCVAGTNPWHSHTPKLECPSCGESFPALPVIDAENGQGYCSEDCHDQASERYWTAVWSA